MAGRVVPVVVEAVVETEPERSADAIMVISQCHQFLAS